VKRAAVAALEALRSHRDSLGNPHLRDLFAIDPGRFERFSLTSGDLTLDYSKNRIAVETLQLMLKLAEAAEVTTLRDQMFAGQPINITEGRAVLHVALRNSKVHARCDNQGRPLGFILTGGEASDYGAVDDLMALPVTKPKVLLADKGYDGDAVRANLLIRGILPIIPPKANRREPIACDFHRYRGRNRIEGAVKPCLDGIGKAGIRPLC